MVLRLSKYFFFFMSAAFSLGHSIFPHRHPAGEKQSGTHHQHRSSPEHEENEDAPYKEDGALPLFVHFSNTDYVASKFCFEVKEKTDCQDQHLVSDTGNPNFYNSPSETFSKISLKEEFYSSNRARPPLLRAPPSLS